MSKEITRPQTSVKVPEVQDEQFTDWVEVALDPVGAWNLITALRADAIAVGDMIRQAVADAESKALRKVVAKIRPSLSPSGNGVVIAALHREADAIEAMIPKED